MKHIINLLILFIFSTNCYASEVFHTLMLSNTMSIMEEMSNNKSATVATGFLINYNNNEYLVTAKHVIDSGTLDSVTILPANFKEGDIAYVVPLKDYKKHNTFDVCLVKLKEKIPCNVNESMLYNDWEQGQVLDTYSIGFPYGSISPVIRSGPTFFPFLNVEKELTSSMITFPGASGSPIYSIELNKIIGIRTGKEETKDYAFVVPAYAIKELLEKE